MNRLQERRLALELTQPQVSAERWVPIRGYEQYQISTEGRVRNRYGKILRYNRLNTGYYSVMLYDGKANGKRRTIHRIVAENFIPNPQGLPFVNHKDEGRTNNSVDNLEWVTPQENIAYGSAIARMRSKKFKAVVQLSTDGVPIQEFPSLSDAAKAVHSSHGNIWAVIVGRKKTCKGFGWRYAAGGD